METWLTWQKLPFIVGNCWSKTAGFEWLKGTTHLLIPRNWFCHDNQEHLGMVTFFSSLTIWGKRVKCTFCQEFVEKLKQPYYTKRARKMGECHSPSPGLLEFYCVKFAAWEVTDQCVFTGLLYSILSSTVLQLKASLLDSIIHTSLSCNDQIHSDYFLVFFWGDDNSVNQWFSLLAP